MTTAHRFAVKIVKKNPGIQIDELCDHFHKGAFDGVHPPTLLEHLVRERQIVGITIEVPTGDASSVIRTFYYPLGTRICL